jgi:hypothetical protein
LWKLSKSYLRHKIHHKGLLTKCYLTHSSLAIPYNLRRIYIATMPSLQKSS